MTEFVTWESALELRRNTDAGIDDPDRRNAARDAQDAYVTDYTPQVSV